VTGERPIWRCATSAAAGRWQRSGFRPGGWKHRLRLWYGRDFVAGARSFRHRSTGRQQVDGNVASFDMIDESAVYVLGTDGNLWQETAPFGTVPPTRQLLDRLVVQDYRFALNSFQILNTRSGNIFSTSKDTDYVSFGLAVNNGQPQLITQSMGDLSNGTFSTNLAFDKVSIADTDNVVLTYHITNNSVGEANATTYLQQVGFKLSSAAVQALATSSAAALGTAIGAAIGTEIPVPLLGSAIGRARWIAPGQRLGDSLSRL
jgi:hypothetical protein